MITAACTRTLTPRSQQILTQAGIAVEHKNVHQYAYVSEFENIELLKGNNRSLVFTSGRGVISHYLAAQRFGLAPNSFKCFVIEGRTATTALQYGYRVIATGKNAIDLAQKILQYSVNEVLHITSNHRRLELEQSLHKTATQYQYLQLYLALPTQVQFRPTENLIVFSPLQFEAFRKNDNLMQIKRIFCIGATTQKQVAQYFSQEIIVATKPAEEAMIQCLIAYFESAFA